MRRILFLLAILFSLPAFAGEPLIFRESVRDAREESVLTFLKTQKDFVPQSPYAIATTDLNGDGVDEWIVRQEVTGCESRADCLYFIAGLSEKTPTLLGQIAARKIGIADEKLYGVRKLFVYNNPQNDFDSLLYVWTPSRAAFGPE